MFSSMGDLCYLWIITQANKEEGVEKSK